MVIKKKAGIEDVFITFVKLIMPLVGSMTVKQVETLAAYYQYRTEKGKKPTGTIIASMLGLKVNTAEQRVHHLRNKGLLENPAINKLLAHYLSTGEIVYRTEYKKEVMEDLDYFMTNNHPIYFNKQW